MKTQTKKIICLLVAIASVMTIVSTVSYAYFSAIGDVKEEQQASLSMANLALRFADNDEGVSAKLNFGETVTKKFVVENTGTADASLSLDWYNLINTYTNGSLTYKLSYSPSENGQYTTIIDTTNVPVSSEESSQTLAGELSVPVGETYYYNLDITLNYLKDVNQDGDIKAVFNTLFNVGSPIRYRYYTLKVNPNGGVWDTYSDTQEYQLMNKDTMSISNPTRTGYTFDGWDLKGVSSKLDSTTFTMGIGDAELIARWRVNSYTLSIDTNGGSYSGDTEMDVDYNSTVTVNNPTREGYTFTGWSKTGGTLEGTTFTMSDTSDVTLTANWQINNYKYIVYHNQMNLDGNGYTLVSADTDEGEAEFNSTVKPEVKTYTGFTSPAVQALTIKADTTYPPTQNRVNYNYSRNQYSLTVNANGGTYTGSSPVNMYYGASTTLNVPTKTGYNFANWTASSGTVSGNEFTMGSSAATVTANYTPKTFSVTFNPNGGTVSQASKTVTYDSTYGTLPEPTYSGYKFLGWFTAQTGGTQVTSETQVALSDNQTLYAHWEISNIKVTFNANGGELSIRVGDWLLANPGGSAYTTYAVSSKPGNTYQKMLDDESVEITPSRSDYTFAGWFTEAEGGTQVSLDSIISSSNHTLYAHWENSNVEVTFNANGGQLEIRVGNWSIGSTPTTYNISAVIGESYQKRLNDTSITITASRSGYTFVGWFTEASGGTQVSLNSTVTNKSSHTLYAHWQGSACFTENTLVYTPNGYKNIQDIKVGDKVYSYNEKLGKVEIDEVKEIMIHTNYGYLKVTLENGSILNITDNHPVYDPINKAWKAIGEFKEGDYMLNSKNEKIKIVEIDTIEQTETVYNFEVKNNHNYYVTSSNILVHNKDSEPEV